MDIKLQDKTETQIIKDTRQSYFLTEVPALHNLRYEVSENTEFELTIVDFLSDPIDLSIDVVLKKGAKANIYLASLNSGHNNKVYKIDIDHEEENTYSRTTMSGINAGDGLLRFLGSSYIKNGAHKSDTRQEGKITNLSDKAHSEVSPSLLIKDNDVKASHGAALGAYDPKVLFYLMSRGLTLSESKKLITFGSLLPIINRLGDEKNREDAKKALGELSL